MLLLLACTPDTTALRPGQVRDVTPEVVVSGDWAADFATGEVSDDDGDGWTEQDGDCDDGDGGAHPLATEDADGLDQDCDGIADDGTVRPAREAASCGVTAGGGGWLGASLVVLARRRDA